MLGFYGVLGFQWGTISNPTAPEYVDYLAQQLFLQQLTEVAAVVAFCAVVVQHKIPSFPHDVRVFHVGALQWRCGIEDLFHRRRAVDQQVAVGCHLDGVVTDGNNAGKFLRAGVRVAVAALMTVTIVRLIKKAAKDWISWAIVIVGFLLLTVLKLDSVWLVLIAAVFGILVGRWKKA